MKVPCLLYHDVTPSGSFASSGFSSPDADVYKLSTDEFAAHLRMIRAVTGGRGVRVSGAPDSKYGLGDFLLTFDDGGVSALAHIAPMLQEYGWFGHFFITSDYIGAPGFLTRDQIRELSHLGHVIGSHSCSHPPMISRCSREQLLREWRDSSNLLSDIVGAKTATASIPGGFYSRAVAETAAEAGIEALFTSEPTSTVRRLNGYTLLGRYSIQQGTPAVTAADLAADKRVATLKQSLLWNLKKPLKSLGGQYWLSFRKLVFARREAGR